jgi:hypothetical protein
VSYSEESTGTHRPLPDQTAFFGTKRPRTEDCFKVSVHNVLLGKKLFFKVTPLGKMAMLY